MIKYCMRGCFIALAFLFSLSYAMADDETSYDFSATNEWTDNNETKSVTLYYKILDTMPADSVEVVKGGADYDYPEIVIPSSVEYTSDGEGVGKTYYVESIAASAFSGNATLTNVTIPEYVTSVGDEAFCNCTNLATVVFNAERCGQAWNIFSGCSSISSLTFGTGVLAIPDNIMSTVSKDADYYKDSNKSDTLEVTNFPALETLVIPDNVIYIGQYAFAMNKGLKTVTIGKGVTYLCRDAFADCPNLSTVNYNATDCSSAGYHGNTMNYCAFWNDTNLSSFTIASGVKSIPDFLVYGEYSKGFPSLTALEIPSTVTSIGEKAFCYCTSLATLTLEDGTENLAITTSSSATSFSSCPIATLYLGRDITYTGEYSPFRGNTSLTTLTIGDEVTSIGYYGFYECTGLTEVVIPNNTTNVGEHSFEYCSGLVTLTIGSSVGLIGGNAFANNSNLKNVYYNAADCSSGGWFTVGSSEPWSNIFYDAPLEHFYFGDTVETIPQYLVNGRYSQYPNLTEVTIPASVTKIESHAFNWTDIKTVYCLGSDAAACNSDSFSETRVTDTWLVVPEDAAINYVGSFQATSPKTESGAGSDKIGWTVFDNLREAQISIDTSVVSEHYATCYSPYEYTLAEGLEATVITGMSDDNTKDENGHKVIGLSMDWAYGHGENQTPVVPAGTAVLMRNTEGTGGTSFVNFTENNSSGLESVSNNVIHGTTKLNEGETITTTVGDGENDEDYYFYKFTYGASEPYTATLGFYWMREGGAAFTLPKKKIWLALLKDDVDNASFGTDASTASIPLFTYIDNDGDTDMNTGEGDAATGISSVRSGVPGEKAIYNTAGQRVNEMSRKGVYIVDGKKYIRK